MKPTIAIPVTLFLIVRSYRRNSLTIPGLVAATVTALVHALPESPLPFTLLCVFFLLGTTATKVKHAEKAKLTLSSSGSSGGEGPRTHIQVLANSACASILCLIEYLTRSPPSSPPTILNLTRPNCLALPTFTFSSTSLLLLGITANYAATTADTLSSELGILSRTTPYLILSPFRRVPRGTNGGVTPSGILYGSLGSAAIATVSIMLLPPFCPSPFSPSSVPGSPPETLAGKILTGSSASESPPAVNLQQKLTLFLLIWALGTFGTLLDSLLGALLQASVVDRRTGKVVEGAGGVRVLTRSDGHRRGSSGGAAATSAVGKAGQDGDVTQRRSGPGTASEGNGSVIESTDGSSSSSRYVGSGRDVLDNNGINILMAATMTLVGMAVVCAAAAAGVLA